jgi:RNA polymerase-associated protein RTF1
MEKLKVRLDKGGTNAMMAAINKKNNAVNDANLSRIASEQVARAKSGAADQSANNPTSRRPTKAATYYAIGKGGKDDDAKADDKPAVTPAAVKTSGGKAGMSAPKTPKAGLNSYSIAAEAKSRVMIKAHDVDVSVHPALAGGEDPMATKGLRKGLIPVLRRAMIGGGGLLGADTRPAPVKTLSLQEYRARLDAMVE